mgnify:FL=1
MIEIIRNYFLLFIIYSFIGWIVELINVFIIEHKIVDRGFLIGPYLPIYGFGALFIITFLSKYKSDLITLFCMSTIICATLEYITSFIMEKLFHARWWDYSSNKFNINGRICLETASLFGIGGCIIIYIIQPVLDSIILFFNPLFLNIVAIVLAVIFVADLLVSFKIIYSFKTITNDVRKDSSSEINKMVKKVLSSRSIFTKRLILAFPNVQALTKNFTKKRKK